MSSRRRKRICAFKDCENSNLNATLFTITGRRRNKLKWLEVCGLPDTTSPQACLCDGHFSAQEMETISDYGDVRLKSNAVPTKLVPNPPNTLRSNIPLFVVDEDKNGQQTLLPVFENPRRKRHFCNEALKETPSDMIFQKPMPCTSPQPSGNSSSVPKDEMISKVLVLETEKKDLERNKKKHFKASPMPPKNTKPAKAAPRKVNK